MKILLFAIALSFSVSALAKDGAITPYACGFVTRVQYACILRSDSGNYYLRVDTAKLGPSDKGLGGSTILVPVSVHQARNEKGVGANKLVYSGFGVVESTPKNYSEISFVLETYVPVVPKPTDIISRLKIDGAIVGGDFTLTIK